MTMPYSVTIQAGKRKRTKIVKSKVRARRLIREGKAALRFFGLKGRVNFHKVKKK